MGNEDERAYNEDGNLPFPKPGQCYPQRCLQASKVPQDSMQYQKFCWCDHHAWTGEEKFEFARHEIDLIALTSNSGGPSSISSGVCSFPILDRSHTSTRRSLPAVASTASLCGDHASWRISPLCARNSCSFLLGLRRSHRATSYACKQCVRSWCHRLLHSSFSSDLVSCSCR